MDIDFSIINEKRKHIKLIYVEGNIGCGKSTFLEKLISLNKYYGDYDFVLEPVDEWKSTKINAGTISMLEAYYMDKKKAAMFQVYALFTRLKRIMHCIANTNKKYIVIERSPLSDKNCFLKANEADGNIDEFDKIIYNQLFDFFDKYTELFKPDKIIYLQLSPSACKERIEERSREGEEGIAIEYLQCIHKYHEEWLIGSKATYEICVMNSELNFRDDDNILAEFVKIIFGKQHNEKAM